MESLVYFHTARRLQNETMGIGEHVQPAFSPETIDVVASVAEEQATYDSYQALYEKMRLRVLPFPDNTRRPVEVLDVRPKEHDPAEAMMVFLPMANPLDTNQAFQIATLAAAHPHKRIIAFGNPSGGDYNSGRLNRAQRKLVKQGMDLSPLVELPERYADEARLDRVDYLGYSYGALVAAVAAGRAFREAHTLTPIEPVMGQRLLVGLGRDFKSTEEALAGYVDNANSVLYRDARGDAISGSSYVRGLLRLSNLAIASALSKVDFGKVLDEAVAYQPKMQTTLVWVTAVNLPPTNTQLNCMTN